MHGDFSFNNRLTTCTSVEDKSSAVNRIITSHTWFGMSFIDPRQDTRKVLFSTCSNYY